ncbi:MAG: S8 family serine peptidase, partial [Proteobacteria bacterium]|nr:S8 family serine peptidase [Pseudomonadota bacterium]
MKFYPMLVLAVIVASFSCKKKSSENRQLGNPSGTLSAARSPVASKVLGSELKETETVPGKIIFRSMSSQGAAVNAQGFKSFTSPVDNITRVTRILNRSETAKIKASSLFAISSLSRTDSLVAKSAADKASTTQELLSIYEIITVPALQDLTSSNKNRTNELIRQLNKDNPGTAFAEIKAYAFLSTNDPYMPPSMGAWNQTFFDLWGLDKINATQAWDISQGDGQIVAVIDTGVDSLHEDLTGQVIPGFNAIYSLDNAFDDHGHGTHVAGTIAATANNSKGIAGVAPKSKILPVKVLDYQGLGELSVIAKGIKWAADHGATVINMSLGAFISPENVPPYLSDAMAYAYGKGIPIIVAAGNSALNMRSFSPANDPHAFSVAATNSQDQLATFSNSGPRLGISAPGGGDTSGGDVFSALASILSVKSSGSKFASSYNVGEKYLRLAGTSMAAPHIAGTAALLKSKYSNYTVPQIYQAIRIGADDISTPGFDDKTGPGRVNALKALTTPVPLTILLTSVMPSKSYVGAETSLTGVVGGENLKSWSLEFSVQSTSVLSWVPLATGSTPISGDIAKWTIPKNLLDKSLV